MPEPNLVWAVWGTAGLNFVVLLLPLLVRGPRRDDAEEVRLDSWRLLWVFLWFWGLYAIETALLPRFVSIQMFGAIHVVYVGLVVVLPALAGAGLLVHWLSGRTKFTQRAVRLLALATLAGPVGFYATFVEPFWLRVDSVAFSVPDSRAGKAPIRVGILADIQTDAITDYEHRVVTELLALEPDLVLIPGDLFQGSLAELDAELPEIHRLLARLDVPAGAYFTPGNTDWTSHLEKVVEGTGVKLLVEESISISVRDRIVTLGGIDIDQRSKNQMVVIDDLETRAGDDDIRILISHYPDWFLRVRPQSRIDLVVSGHTHGGQVQIPFFGPPITLSRVPRAIAGGGLHERDGRRIYVSTGVGHEEGQAPRLRFLCRPSIGLIVIE